jgi:hypothetical protein
MNMNIYYTTLFLIIMISSSSALSTENTISPNTISENEPLAFVEASRVEFNDDYFLGEWIAEGYTCFGTQPPNEYITMAYEGGKFVATKKLGDGCVLSGSVTFDGMQSTTGYNDGQDYNVNIRLGNVANPSSGNTNSSIRIVDLNHFKTTSYNLHYYRRTPYPNVAPVAVSTGASLDPRYFEFLPETFFVGKWYVEGLGCLSKCDGLSTIQDEVTLSYTQNEFIAKRNNGDVAFRGQMYNQKSQNKKGFPINISNNDYRNQTITNPYSKLRLLRTDLFKVDSWNLLFTRIKLIA